MHLQRNENSKAWFMRVPTWHLIGFNVSKVLDYRSAYVQWQYSCAESDQILKRKFWKCCPKHVGPHLPSGLLIIIRVLVIIIALKRAITKRLYWTRCVLQAKENSLFSPLFLQRKYPSDRFSLGRENNRVLGPGTHASLILWSYLYLVLFTTLNESVERG